MIVVKSRNTKTCENAVMLREDVHIHDHVFPAWILSRDYFARSNFHKIFSTVTLSGRKKVSVFQVANDWLIGRLFKIM